MTLEKEFNKIASSVSYTLRKMKLESSVISITLKDSMFISSSRQKKIEYTNSFDDIVKHTYELLAEHYTPGIKIRYICVAVSNLKNQNESTQLDIFNMVENVDNEAKNKKKEVTEALDKLKNIYGDKIDYASAIDVKNLD